MSDPFDYDVDDEDYDECPNCMGFGVIYCCFSEYACIDPENGCDLCERPCDWCQHTPPEGPHP